MFNRSLQKTWGVCPLTPGEIRHIAKGLRWLIVPELTTAAEIDGKLVGAMFGMLDYNPRIKRIDGRLLPFGFLRLLWNRRAIKRVRLVSTNVIPEYQMMGIGLVLLRAMRAAGHRLGAGRGGVLLGLGVQRAFPRKPGKGRHAAAEDLSRLRLPVDDSWTTRSMRAPVRGGYRFHSERP